MAQDDATEAVYNPHWETSDNGGSGWGGGWTLTTSGGNAGHFWANGSGEYNSGTEAWGMFANSGDEATASRSFASALTSGQVFSLTFENGFIDTGAGVGFELKNAAGSSLVEFFFVGGQTNFTVRDSLGDRDTGLNFTSSGFPLSFELTGADTYYMAFDALTMTGSLMGIADQAITQFSFYNDNAGGGSDHDFFLNDLALTSPGSAGMNCDTVKVIRTIVELQDGIPVWWWQKYGLGAGETAEGNSDSDDATNGEEWLADSDPTNSLSFYDNQILTISGTTPMTVMSGTPTTNSRVYDVWVSTDLELGDWQPLNLDVPGEADGSAVPLMINNTTEYLYMQTGVKIP
jgi:hypothetical protein